MPLLLRRQAHTQCVKLDKTIRVTLIIGPSIFLKGNNVGIE
jgi:hypothetical protein